MAPSKITLVDDDSRRKAITTLDQSILVEAGAGSGKTAIMAGRIAYMLLEGIEPKSIAAVTFTELAASQLLERVRKFAENLAENKTPIELKTAIPNGLTETQTLNIKTAVKNIDEISCNTIHGFCYQLIKPYPAEANIDPGASVLDASQATLIFNEIVDDWIRKRLSTEKEGGFLPEMVMQDPRKTINQIREIANKKRDLRSLKAPEISSQESQVKNFIEAVDDLSSFIDESKVVEPNLKEIGTSFQDLAFKIKKLDLKNPKDLVQMLALEPDSILVTKTTGNFRSYRKKGDWEKVAQAKGFSKPEGAALYFDAHDKYENCCNAWDPIKGPMVNVVLADLISETEHLYEKYTNIKHNSALLDFEDLIYSTRDMLRNFDEVRQALGERYQFILVDEFQDTDPLQTEIFWRLCGDPPKNEENVDDWQKFTIRPGALFLVGDPKQAIYRFRGADIQAYNTAKDNLTRQSPNNILEITTNFRSCKSILDFVNEQFSEILAKEFGQPGFAELNSIHQDPPGQDIVVAIDIPNADGDEKPNQTLQRNEEANAIALLCRNLIGNFNVIDFHTNKPRPCNPGDIALLAPTGTELWIYEEALENLGIPVSTQAGKGLFRRQEVQDLIAITRILADQTDTIALGALLRGPLVGLSEEELADIIWNLPRSKKYPDKIPTLKLWTDCKDINHDLARDIISKLQNLAKKRYTTTPFQLLSDAVNELRVRPIVNDRYQYQSERALANIELFLSLTSNYEIRGIRAFSEAMTLAWEDEMRAVEGRPDAQREAVALYTMHAAKGLEWPIVIPINTMTRLMHSSRTVVDSKSDTLYMPVFGEVPIGHDEISEYEKAELYRERIRLWYVTLTRACQLLVIPRHEEVHKNSWYHLIENLNGNLKNTDKLISSLPNNEISEDKIIDNEQTLEQFESEATFISEVHTKIKRVTPSRSDSDTVDAVLQQSHDIWTDEEGIDVANGTTEIEEPQVILGSKDRGSILHKLMEEIIIGEISDDSNALVSRARELIIELGLDPVEDPSEGLSPTELAECVQRTFAIPEISKIRSGLSAEVPVYALNKLEDKNELYYGIADALYLNSEGKPSIVIDWKSDVKPDEKRIQKYTKQVKDYLKIVGVKRGMIVFMTNGEVKEIENQI